MREDREGERERMSGSEGAIDIGQEESG